MASVTAVLILCAVLAILPDRNAALQAQAAPRSVLAVHSSEVCFDGKYFGKSGMESFFVGFGTEWTYHTSFGGMLAVPPDARDKGHHKSVLRSLPFNVTPRTTFSLTTRGGMSSMNSVNGTKPELSGLSSENGALGIAVRCTRTGLWSAVKSRTKGGEEEEVITFTPDDLKWLVGEQVTVDVVDTRAGIWGWIAVDGFLLQGSCNNAGLVVKPAGDTAMSDTPMSEEAAWAAKNLGDICTYLDSAEKMATFFNALGTAWEWQFDLGGAMFNTDPRARDTQHPKSILRSIPFTIDPGTSISATTLGGVGYKGSVRSKLANYSGMSTTSGFLGIAIRSAETDHWLLSKQRHNPQADAEEVLEFTKDELAKFVGQAVTLDVVDMYTGDNGWIGLRNFRLRGPCVHVQFKPKPTLATTAAPATTTLEVPEGTCTVDRITARPSLFCFSVMSPEELKIIGEQFKRRASVFACNAFTIISKLAISIGKDPCGADVYTWHNDVSASTLGDTDNGAATSSFLNTKTFLLAWDSILLSNKWQSHDFIAKADPDCVFFPDRLRSHLNPYMGQSVFFLNCNALTGRMYGALEVFSTQAVQKYHDNVPQCKKMDWKSWGEDLYMESCMRGLGVKAEKDYKQVGDDRCTKGPCTDTSRAAYHPYKDSASYWKCWEESGGK